MTTAPGPEEGRLVLLADDFDDARDMYSEYLRLSGIRVITAAGGQEAIDLAREHLPALILMDIRMPGVTGTDAMLELRKDPRLARVPMIALTAHALDRERAAILADGFDDVISKPCLPDELVAIVRKRLGDIG